MNKVIPIAKKTRSRLGNGFVLILIVISLGRGRMNQQD
jgi:hypothetical protein